MPCYSGQGQDYADKGDIDSLKRELDTVTDILCSLLKLIPEENLNEKILSWKRKHTAFDKQEGR